MLAVIDFGSDFYGSLPKLIDLPRYPNRQEFYYGGSPGIGGGYCIALCVGENVCAGAGRWTPVCRQSRRQIPNRGDQQ